MENEKPQWNTDLKCDAPDDDLIHLIGWDIYVALRDGHFAKWMKGEADDHVASSGLSDIERVKFEESVSLVFLKEGLQILSHGAAHRLFEDIARALAGALVKYSMEKAMAGAQRPSQ